VRIGNARPLLSGDPAVFALMPWTRSALFANPWKLPTISTSRPPPLADRTRRGRPWHRTHLKQTPERRSARRPVIAPSLRPPSCWNQIGGYEASGDGHGRAIGAVVTRCSVRSFGAAGAKNIANGVDARQSFSAQALGSFSDFERGTSS